MPKPSTVHRFGKVEGNRHTTYHGGWRTIAINTNITLSSATAFTICTVPAGAQPMTLHIKHNGTVVIGTAAGATAYGVQWDTNATALDATPTATAIPYFDIDSNDFTGNITTVTAGVSRVYTLLQKRPYVTTTGPGTLPVAKKLVLKCRPDTKKFNSGKIRVQLTYIEPVNDLNIPSDE